MQKLYIIVPAYNEAQNIKTFINDWYPIIATHNADNQSRLVIINDGSKDNTLDILKECAKDKPLLTVLDKPNGGHGSTLLYGYRYAIENHADYIFQTDSDGQTLPSEFEQFWTDKDECDVILGNRTVRGDGKDRKFVENVLCFILRMIFGVKVPDANAPFRLMKTDLVEKYLKLMPENFNLPNVILSTAFVYNNEKVKFISITFRPRQAGTNSINIKKIIKIGWKACFDFIEIKKNMKNYRS